MSYEQIFNGLVRTVLCLAAFAGILIVALGVVLCRKQGHPRREKTP